jgi:predicted secreted protein
MFRTALLSAVLLTTGLVGAASAADSFPVSSQGESFSADYSHDMNNIVGGGFARATGGNDVRISYADPSIGNKAPGIPVFVGGSEGRIAYIAPSHSATLAAR